MESEFHKDDSDFCNRLEALLRALATHKKTMQHKAKSDPKWVRVLYKPLAGGEMVFYVCFFCCSSGGGGSSKSGSG